MVNLVEMFADDADQDGSPCVNGKIVAGHACYCHATDSNAPRKCPIWRNYGLDPEKWHNSGDINTDDWDGGCKWFESNIKP